MEYGVNVDRTPPGAVPPAAEGRPTGADRHGDRILVGQGSAPGGIRERFASLNLT